MAKATLSKIDWKTAVVAALIGAVVAGSAVYVWQQRESRTDLSHQANAKWNTLNTKYGFSVRYPKEWIYGQNRDNSITYLASDQSYINLANGIPAEIPKTGFQARVFVSKGIVPTGANEKQALRLESGREVPAAVEETYGIIDGSQYYRAKRKQEGKVNRTYIEYSIIRKSDLYRVWFQIDDNNPENMIELFDHVAMTFRFE